MGQLRTLHRRYNVETAEIVTYRVCIILAGCLLAILVVGYWLPAVLEVHVFRHSSILRQHAFLERQVRI